MKLYTIGFTKKTAETFFGLLRSHGVQMLADIRLRPDGQLAGFAKQADLPYFLRELAACDYRHLPILAPSHELLSDYRTNHDWSQYVQRFKVLMDERGIPQNLDRQLFDEHVCCLLCSEDTADRCHRRLVAERLAAHWPGVQVTHL
jgi:uncharacterized protein (DUF488 family)